MYSPSATSSPKLRQTSQLARNSRSVPSTPAKSRPASMYSNWSYTGSNFTANSSNFSSGGSTTGSSVTSLNESCRCSERSAIDQSMQSLQSKSCSRPTDLLYSSVYRFSHRYLPESLILYLNVESTAQQETFFGPILDEGAFANQFCSQMPNAFSSLSSNAAAAQLLLSQQNPQLISSVTTELVAEIRRFQVRLLKLTELERNRQKGKPLPMQLYSPLNSGQIVTLTFDLITCKRIITSDHQLTNSSGDQQSSSSSSSSLTVSFRFYLLGRCFSVEGSQPVDQFYACFKMNNSKNTEAVKELMSKASRSSKWSLGRLSLKLDIKSNSGTFSSKKNGSFSIGLLDRSTDYETVRLDNLRGDFEELMQTVRFGSAN